MNKMNGEAFYAKFKLGMTHLGVCWNEKSRMKVHLSGNDLVFNYEGKEFRTTINEPWERNFEMPNIQIMGNIMGKTAAQKKVIKDAKDVKNLKWFYVIDKHGSRVPDYEHFATQKEAEAKAEALARSNLTFYFVVEVKIKVEAQKTPVRKRTLK